MVIISGRIGCLLSVKNDLPVRLIRDQENIVTEFPGFAFQHFRQAGQGLFRVDGAGRIIGGVDQDRCHGRGQLLLQVLKVDLEMFRLGLHDLDPGPCLIDIGIILGEEGGKYDDLVAGLGHSPQGMGQGSGRAGRRENMMGAVLHAETAVEGGRYFLLDGRQACGRGVAVQSDGILFLQIADTGFPEAVRGGDRGIAQAVVKYIFVADLFPSGGRVFRKLADHGFV